MVCPKFRVDYYVLIYYTHCQELMKSAGMQWQLITAILNEEGDSLAICEQLS
jgi:hypothetical protein